MRGRRRRGPADIDAPLAAAAQLGHLFTGPHTVRSLVYADSIAEADIEATADAGLHVFPRAYRLRERR